MPRLSLRSAALLALLILILGGLQWRTFRAQLIQARVERDLLRESLQAEGGQEKAVDSTAGGRAREAAVGAGRQLAKRLLEVEARLEQMRDQALEPDPELVAEQLRLMNDAVLQSAEGLRDYLEELQQTGDLTDPHVLVLISRAFHELADRNPESVLALLTRPQPGLTPQIIEGVASRALKAWGLRSPDKAAAWLKERLAAEPGFFSQGTLMNLGTALAEKDPAAALTIMQGHLNAYQMVSSLMADMGSAAGEVREKKRTVALEYLLTLPEGGERDEAANTYYRNTAELIRDGQFEQESARLDQHPLGYPETKGILSAFYANDLGADQGKWMDWIAAKGQMGDNVFFSDAMGSWARRHPDEAVAWALQNPDLGLQYASLQGFIGASAAMTVEQAENVAAKLPDEAVRTEILRRALGKIPAEDPEARAAFAKKHGLK